MTKRIYVIPLVLILSASAFFAARFFYFQKKKGNQFNSKILSVDLSLKENAYREARSKLEKIDPAILDLTESKRYLNRVYNVSKNTGSYSLFNEKLSKAAEKYPHDKELQILYLFSLIHTEAYKKASEYSNKNIKNEKLDTLKWELFLRDPNNADLQFTGNPSPFLSLNSGDSSVYENAAAETKDIGFLYDEALLYLGEGLSEKAYIILEKLPVTYKKRTVLLFYSAYQEKRYNEALTLIDTYDLGFPVQSILLYKSDLLMHLKLYNKAENAYMNIVNLYPKASWIPYANLAWISSVNGDRKTLSGILKGLDFFPQNLDLLYSIVSYLISIDDNNLALSLIEKYGNNDPVLNAVMLRLKGNMEPALYIVRLQQIVFKQNVSDQLRKYYCTFLAKTGNIGLLDSYISALQKQGINSQWILFYKALVAVNKGSLNVASDLFEKLYPSQKDWTLLFDEALTQYYNNNYKRALELFQNAESNAVSDKTRSEIRTFTAMSLEKLGNMKRALKELHYALDLDKSNMKAFLELTKIQKLNK